MGFKKIWLFSLVTVLNLTACFDVNLQSPDNSEQHRNQLKNQLTEQLTSYSQEQLIANTQHIDQSRNLELENLGMELFFSKALSGNFDVACASCHHPLLSGGDGLSLPIGEAAYIPDLLGPGRWHNWKGSGDPRADGAPNMARHSPTTFNTGLIKRAMFADGRVFVLDEEEVAGGRNQFHHTPDSTAQSPDVRAGEDLLASASRFPVVTAHEMTGFSFSQGKTSEQIRDALAQRLRSSSGWLSLFKAGFDEPTADEMIITYENIQTAIAAYLNSQTLINNPWYDFLQGDESALSDKQLSGAILFFKPVAEGGAGCVNCHTPKSFTDESFHNIAIPQFGRGGQLNKEDFGRRGVTLLEQDRYKFKTPTLLNIEVTGPYSHTGAFLDLASMIKHHITPQASIDEFDFSLAGNSQMRYVGGFYPNAEVHTLLALQQLIGDQQNGISLLPADITLSEIELAALIEFMKALTDPCVKNEVCLKQFIPASNSTAPDEHRLVASFSQFAAPDESVKDAPTEPLDPSGFNQPVEGVKSLITNLTCNKEPIAINSLGFQFESVAADVGINATHEVEVSIYDSTVFMMNSFTGGAAVGDVNNDCFNDIYYVTGSTSPDKLFINNKDGSFTDKSNDWNINQQEFSNGASFVDIDGDGDLDLFTSNLKHPFQSTINFSLLKTKTTTYKNNNHSSFSVWPEMSITASYSTSSFAFADVDADEYLDVLSTHWQVYWPQTNHLWMNENGSGLLEANNSHNLNGLVSSQDFTWTGIFSDFNADGFIDILMAADFENSQIYANRNGVDFEQQTHKSILTDSNSMGPSVIDFDNDGDLDWFVTSVVGKEEGSEQPGPSGTGNKLYENNNGVFTDITDAAGVGDGGWGWGSCAADFNNDSWPDLFHVNGFSIYSHLLSQLLLIDHEYFNRLTLYLGAYHENPNKLFINNADGTFSEQADTWGITDLDQGRSAICFDYDRDGDIDIFITNHQQYAILYKNHARSNDATNFINIHLKGIGKNTQAIGAKVYVTANGVTQFQEVKAGGSFLAGAPTELHFGLGADTTIEEVKVVWPRPHYYEYSLQGVSANQFIIIEQPQE